MPSCKCSQQRPRAACGSFNVKGSIRSSRITLREVALRRPAAPAWRPEMFWLETRWNSNETGTEMGVDGIEPVACGERKSSDISTPFAHQHKCYLQQSRKRKRPSARCMSRKRSWSSSWFVLYPVRRAPYVGRRVDGFTRPFKAGDLLPFRWRLFYNRRISISTVIF